MLDLRIGEVAERTGTSTPTIRYYESIGLLPTAARRQSGQRIYSEGDLQRLLFIRRCRDFGFTIEQVRTLAHLQGDPTRSCLEVRELAETHLRTIREKLADLRALEWAMSAFAASCADDCAGGPGSACVPLVALVAAR